ncbi:hypothetical protein C6T65_32905 [Burkholderia vietnamiensis]|uniref:Uncharacterized protein n=2 Tax=Burkholderia vietnamiensis TaxID=60552 RepID=A0AA44XV54_BURVI|nr:hypothetical protein C6T65_32905 [Burkholderia vietnamiensis]
MQTVTNMMMTQIVSVSAVPDLVLDNLVGEVFPAAFDDEVESLRKSVRPSVDEVITALQRSRAAFNLAAETEVAWLRKTGVRASAVFDRFLRNVEAALD